MFIYLYNIEYSYIYIYTTAINWCRIARTELLTGFTKAHACSQVDTLWWFTRSKRKQSRLFDRAKSHALGGQRVLSLTRKKCSSLWHDDAQESSFISRLRKTEKFPAASRWRVAMAFSVTVVAGQNRWCSSVLSMNPVELRHVLPALRLLQ